MKQIICIFLLCISSYLYADASKKIDDVYYDSLPIDLIVSQKKESVIFFPNSVKVKDDYGNSLSILNTDKTVFIKALAEFQSKRLLFQDLETQKIYIFNLASNNANNPRNIRVLLPSKKETNSAISKNPIEGGPYLALTQHASMSLYYPERYKPTTKGVHPVKLEKKNVDYFISFNGSAETVAAWKGFGFFITAIKVKNHDKKELTLDPRIHFRGNWLFLSLQHSWLGKSSNKEESVTTVYVISKRPFWESLL